MAMATQTQYHGIRLGGHARPTGRAAVRPTVVCVMCDAVLERGTTEVSHGLCQGCLPRFGRA